MTADELLVHMERAGTLGSRCQGHPYRKAVPYEVGQIRRELELEVENKSSGVERTWLCWI